MTDAPMTGFEDLLQGDLSIRDISALKRRVFSSKENRKALQELINSLESRENLEGRERTALSVCYCVEGRYGKGLDAAADHGGSDVARYVACKCRLGLGRPAEAVETLKALADKLDEADVQAVLAEALRRAGDIEEARKAVETGLKKYPDNPMLLTEAGMIADMDGDYAAAMEYYGKACREDECCAEALFRIAYVADLRGDNETALDYYQRCIKVKPVRSRALVNLGLLYEEMGRQGDAVRCFKLVTMRYPENRRARLYLKDAVASEDMYFDEEMQKRRERHDKILETPITDFELSVRSRNCLEKMNVSTLGDLTRISEPDLLSFKNFGETSLNEIKQMLATKNLRLGQALEEEESRSSMRSKPIRRKTIDKDKVLARSVDDLGLSVRSQHCMQALGIATVGDLVAKSEKELMQAKNFGHTSLVEVRKKLAVYGLTLAED